MIYINNFKLNNENRPYIIAEMACAHDGDVNKAYRLIDATYEAKADAIQFQIFHTDEIVVGNHDIYNLLKTIEFDKQSWIELARYAKEKQLDLFICTYDLPSVDIAVEVEADGIKLDSSDLLNFDLLEKVVSTQLPFTLGIGASTIEEISKAVEFIKSFGYERFVLMHGVQNFPTAIEDLNIARVAILKKLFNLPVGYHDHTDAELPFSKMVDLIAIGAGANLIEKHITLDRAQQGTDYQAALEPQEFKEFVKTIHLAYKAFGNSSIKPLSQSDYKYRTFQKKSIVAIKDIQKGEKITKENIKFLRNTTNGLSPDNFKSIVNKPVKKVIKKYTNITFEDVELS